MVADLGTVKQSDHTVYMQLHAFYCFIQRYPTHYNQLAHL